MSGCGARPQPTTKRGSGLGRERQRPSESLRWDTSAFPLQRGQEKQRGRISPQTLSVGVVCSGLLLRSHSLGEARGVRSGHFPI